MCGRFTLAVEPDVLERRFRVEVPADWRPRYNIAPSQDVLIIVSDGGQRRAGFVKWGLIPHWSKKVSPLINARAETAAVKPAFRRAFHSKRCLIPATGFFEWRKEEDRKQPYLIRLRDGKPFAFAGLWEKWEGPSGTYYGCAILTTKPNTLVARIHDRMPVILEPENEDLWLDRTVEDRELLTSLLHPFPPEKMEAFPVSERVNSPKFDDPQCIVAVNKYT